MAKLGLSFCFKSHAVKGQSVFPTEIQSIIFGLQAFNVVFHKAVEMAEASEDVTSRVNLLIDCVTFSTFNFMSRGLFERDKLTFTAQLAFQVRLSQ